MATVGATINVGDTVNVLYTPLSGEVQGAVLVGTEINYLVEYIDNEGEVQQRYFSIDQIETLV